ncbi:similar to Saccharomyces cerevisiae YLR336C SGD1 Essential nuclear protein, required for biogenesis of the small ribosomal subunit [Maudiozyma barnettii]|uniref:Similar to Saccharomyces cerevisiae YLR336C SGD1 Essential nuclear protein, required for biogenesis of the small ribosomal subunit n=1 Tax=Maudiozyma barnettii TaxID=61262 RepID=A0A8H2ZIU1_9SACH|nr:Sgd1p [Kazachstania barnettii]CAB4257304.1 similar to Saccharomyces cerevisiae YLR336C SGD1 Essential nuclear protein, required for biogenesis of the small ribosomal subunit [Kazachstania barnettii]CAD1784569.1 similar to Saccharomyces cerevisiae YLR336C SGD1 Essential nuclear protein, required for biogenesis of the small ribosomal subunit [Kazachstania barnettii]
MSRRHNQQQGGINIPGIILDELKDRDYSNDDRFKQSKKRNSTKQLGRKERRKQQRSEKKNKRINRGNDSLDDGIQSNKSLDKTKNIHNHKVKTIVKKTKPQPKEKKKDEELPFSSDDELSAGDFEEFEEGDLDEEELRQLQSLEENESEGDDIESDEIISDNEDQSSADEADVMDQLKRIKEKKTFKKEDITAEETMALLKSKKSKQQKLNAKKIDSETEESYPLPPSERMAMEKDEMDMQYYAKKLKLKKGKKTISAADEFDAIGGLLEGLDFVDNYGASDEEYGDFAFENDKSSGRTTTRDEDKPFSSDDELSEGDFDEFSDGDLDEDEWDQLKELEDDETDESGDETSERSNGNKTKENPYVAPNSTSTDTGSYIPPSLRKHQLQKTRAESSASIEITKKVKSSLNRLSESNITHIIKSLDELFDSYPRQYVIEIITEQLLEMVVQKNKLLDTYILNFAAVSFAIFRLRGLEIGAHFIQSTVELFLNQFKKQKDEFANMESEDAAVLPKESLNIVTLLSYTYDFGFISCKLLYDIIEMLVSEPNVLTTELLLRIVAVSGQQIRGDDPFALKQIMSQLLTNVKLIENPSPRLQFLMSTMTDLKNNRLKPSVLASDFHPIKKVVVSTFKAISSAMEPLQVSLKDIENVDTTGKWWLVGASWRGNMNSALEENTDTNEKIRIKDDFLLEDDLLDDIPDWTQIAKENRMNTDIRRAIFVSIMSAQDCVDAFENIEKLGLKNKQILEAPRVLLNCLLADSKENGYNQYYSLVAMKLCEQHHNLLKSFQFLFWDTIQKYEDKEDSDSEDDMEAEITDENVRLRTIANQGKFFGNLLGQGILKLDIFKHVPLISGLTADGNLFIEVMIYQLFQTIAKRSEITKKKEGKKMYQYKDENMVALINGNVMGETKGTILRGLRWFLNNKLKYENYLDPDQKSKAYLRDTRRIEWALPMFSDLTKQLAEDGDY